MTSTLPIDPKDRTIIVDVIREFALIGVLIANFTSYIDQQTPEPILNSISSSLDRFLMSFNSVFLEWKFMSTNLTTGQLCFIASQPHFQKSL